MFRLFNVSSILNHDIITCLIIVVVVVAFLILEKFETRFDKVPKYQQRVQIGHADMIQAH